MKQNGLFTHRQYELNKPLIIHFLGKRITKLEIKQRLHYKTRTKLHLTQTKGATETINQQHPNPSPLNDSSQDHWLGGVKEDVNAFTGQIFALDSNIVKHKKNV